ncbi:MAG: sulfurtransferase [Cellulomonadaceae bacterium]
MTAPTPEPTESPQGSSGAAPAPRKRGTTVLAFVAVAAIAATGGALVGRSIAPASADDAQPPAATATAQTGESTTAETLVTSFAVGENRGLDTVHQGGEDNLENVLVSTDWLAEQIAAGLEENDIVLVDVSEQLASSELTKYPDGHIPGAQFVDWATSFVQPNTREFLDAAEFTELAQSLGINDTTTLVIYGDNNNWFAAYAAWVFKLYGLQDVRLLDGGLKKWEQVDGRELVQEVPQPAQGTFEASVQNFDIRAFQPEVLDVVNGEAEANLIDIRFPDEFNGEVGVNIEIFEGEGATVWGHIPGAINVPWGSIVNEDGTYRSADEIRAVYTEAGVDFDKPIIAYCRIGERASHSWYALSQILGEDVKVYDGSWSEWGNTVGVPVQNNTGDRGGVWSGT